MMAPPFEKGTGVGIQDDVKTAVDNIIATPWNKRTGQVVPSTDTVALADGAVEVKATYLYADMAKSSEAAHFLNKPVAAKVFRSYLNAATRIIKKFEGEIRSFDGDRVMGIFMGHRKNTNAARAALGINWAIYKVLRPKLQAKWSDIEDHYVISHGVGVDTGEAWIVRGGVRGSNDLVSIGSAPNVAAKLASLRRGPHLYITDAVYDVILNEAKIANDGRNMWERSSNLEVALTQYDVMASTWWKAP